MANVLTDKERTLMDAYWRAANYLSVGQIYLYDNPLLKQTLTEEHIKPRLLGHWGTTPGLNFIYVHLNRLIKKHDLNMIYITGPGHGGPGLVANAYLEGTYSEVYPNISSDEEGMKRLFTQFSFPAGSRAMWPRRRPAQFMKAANSAMPFPRLRRRLRQPRSARRLCRRRRRGGDRSAGDELALQQIFEPGDRRGGFADPSPQRLQDRQSHRPGADQPRRIGPSFPRLWLHPVFCRGR